MTAESRTPSLCKPLACGAAVAVVCAVSLFRTDLPMIATPSSQWDFVAYYYAVKTYDAGGNPWNNDEMCQTAGHWVHYFYYPHHTLAFFRLFALGDLASGKALFLAVKLACATALCVLWTTCFVRPGARGWFIAFLAVGFNTALARDLVCGNVSLFEQSLIWFGVYALLRGRPWLFCAFILLAAQFKILPICLLGLVLLTDSPQKWRCFAAGVLSAGLIAAAVYLSDPRAAALFWYASTSLGLGEAGGSVNPSSAGLIAEITSALIERSCGTDVVLVRSIGQWVYVAGALAILVCFAHRVGASRSAMPPINIQETSFRRSVAFSSSSVHSRNLVFLALLTYALLVPRMKDYAYVLLLPAAFEVLRDYLARPGLGRWLILAVLAALSLPGLEMFWPYRSLLLAGWAWLLAVSAVRKRIDRPRSSCPCQPTAWPG